MEKGNENHCFNNIYMYKLMDQSGSVSYFPLAIDSSRSHKLDIYPRFAIDCHFVDRQHLRITHRDPLRQKSWESLYQCVDFYLTNHTTRLKWQCFSESYLQYSYLL